MGNKGEFWRADVRKAQKGLPAEPPAWRKLPPEHRMLAQALKAVELTPGLEIGDPAEEKTGTVIPMPDRRTLRLIWDGEAEDILYTGRILEPEGTVRLGLSCLMAGLGMAACMADCPDRPAGPGPAALLSAEEGADGLPDGVCRLLDLSPVQSRKLIRACACAAARTESLLQGLLRERDLPGQIDLLAEWTAALFLTGWMLERPRPAGSRKERA